MNLVEKIVSGGQIGADRAGLDFAIGNDRAESGERGGAGAPAWQGAGSTPLHRPLSRDGEPPGSLNALPA